jgi:hypothetical protein
MRELLILHGVASPSLLNHGEARLDCVRHQGRAPAKPCESGVYDGGGARNLPCARGSHVPVPVGRYIVASVAFYERGISPLLAAVLWLGITSLDALGDLAHGGLRDSV